MRPTSIQLFLLCDPVFLSAVCEKWQADRHLPDSAEPALVLALVSGISVDPLTIRLGTRPCNVALAAIHNIRTRTGSPQPAIGEGVVERSGEARR